MSFKGKAPGSYVLAIELRLRNQDVLTQLETNLSTLTKEHPD